RVLNLQCRVEQGKRPTTLPESCDHLIDAAVESYEAGASRTQRDPVELDRAGDGVVWGHSTMICEPGLFDRVLRHRTDPWARCRTGVCENGRARPRGHRYARQGELRLDPPVVRRCHR